MGKLALGAVLLIFILVVVAYLVWSFTKSLGVAPKGRIYLIGIVFIVVIAICASLFIEDCTSGKNNGTNNKEEVEFQL